MTLSTRTKQHQSARPITALTNRDAKRFFLRQENYTSIDLPTYFVFDQILGYVDNTINKQRLPRRWRAPARDLDDVNYTLLTNKDGRYAWRSIDILNPVLYVSLVNEITKPVAWDTILSRFSKYQQNPNIECASIPVDRRSPTQKTRSAQILSWWEHFEQRSIQLALEYEYVIATDVTDCYPSIYTHSIAWALHGKQFAKQPKQRGNQSLIGVVIDNHVQDMRFGQTNGIPQGSVLMDFIAEMVLGYADMRISRAITDANIDDYFILRYRDDYRIFVNNPLEGEQILKLLTSELFDLSLRLNPQKTNSSSETILDSVKSDKLAWIGRRNYDRNLQKHLLIIYQHSLQYPNSGSVVRALSEWDSRLLRAKYLPDPMVLISIVSEIALRNPATYPLVAAIFSKLFSQLPLEIKRYEIVDKIVAKFGRVPHAGHMDIWLQRISHPFGLKIQFDERLCNAVTQPSIPIWNYSWISMQQWRQDLESFDIIDAQELADAPAVIPQHQVHLFMLQSGLSW